MGRMVWEDWAGGTDCGIMAALAGPLVSWHILGLRMSAVSNFSFATALSDLSWADLLRCPFH